MRRTTHSRTKKTKRTLTPEQIQKMQEGREKAKARREEEARQKERVDMLSELDARLAAGRRNASDRPVHIRTRRRHHF